MNSKIKILHLEDVRSDAVLIHNQLKKSNLDCEILVVTTKENFSRELKDFSPDIILADYSLPSFNAHDALNLLHEMGFEIPFILVTATMSDELAVDIIKKGADDYILKDRLARLSSAIQNELEKYRLKRAKENIFNDLLSSQLHLKEALKIANVGTWETDLQTNTIKWSEETHDIFETDMKGFQVNYQNFLDFVHPDDRDKLNTAIENSLTSTSDTSVEHRIILSNGTLKHVIENWKTFYDQKGNPVRAVGTCRDVTAQKLSEQKLLESELFNKGVLASLSAQIAVVSADGTLVAVNKAWDDFALANGPVHLSDNSVGSNYFTVCKAAIASGEDDAQQTLNGIVSVFNKAIPYFRLEYPCHSPEENRWFMLNVLPFGEDATKVVIAHQNITERKIAENNLSETAVELTKTLAELNKILDSSLDVICTINAAGAFVNVSAASQQVWGYTPEELIGVKFMDLVYKEDAEITIEASEVITSGVKLTAFENRYVNKNGKLVYMLWSANWDEKLQVMFCIAKDITEKKRLEKAIERERNQFYEMFFKAPSSIGMLKGANHVFEMANPLYLQQIGKQDVIGKTVEEVLPEVIEQGFISLLDHVYQTGESYADTEVLVKVDTQGNGELTDFYIDFVYQAYRNEAGAIEGVFFFINDITEQILSRKRVEKSEKFFKGVIENSADMINMLDATGRTIYASPAVSKKFGYSTEEALQLNLMDVVHPDDLPVIGEFFAEVLRHPSIPMSCPLIRNRIKDGSYIWIESTITNFLETEGINAIVVNFRDITERKVAESKLTATLIELEAERTRLVEAQTIAKIGSWETDLQTFQVSWSAESHRIYGTDPDTFKPSYDAIQDLVHPEDRDKLDIAFKDSLSEIGSNCIEHRIITVQGIEKCIEQNWTVSRDINGLPMVAFGTCQDITESKKSADKVTRSEAKLKIAQQIAHVGSWEVDMLTNENSWSDEFYRILGISEDTKPSDEKFISFIHPDDRAMAVCNVEDSYSRLADSSFHFRFIRNNGEIGYASTEWQFEYDNDRNPLYIHGILRDLTKEKNAEIERVKMVSDIVRRNKDLEQFSYIVSHNLRSPVANIIGLTEELIDDSHSSETKILLGEALNSDVKRLENVIADLNAILQTKREITERKEPVVFSQLVNGIKLSINDLIQKHGVQIQTDFNEVDKIDTIKTYIQSIFYNLITNSIKYRRRDIDCLIEIKSQLRQDKLCIVFTDNGSGIDLVKTGDQIFGLYKRFHFDTEGKGMGLYMVKTQVETLGGKISVKSSVNKGTEFTIEFEIFE